MLGCFASPLLPPSRDAGWHPKPVLGGASLLLLCHGFQNLCGQLNIRVQKHVATVATNLKLYKKSTWGRVLQCGQCCSVSGAAKNIKNKSTEEAVQAGVQELCLL